MDADTVNESLAEQEYDEAHYLLKLAAGNAPFRVFLPRPELEIVFINAPGLLDKIAGRHLSPAERELAEVKPKKFLQSLMNDKTTEWPALLLKDLTEDELKSIQQTETIDALLQFIRNPQMQTIEADSIH
jgi:hypothetical protein